MGIVQESGWNGRNDGTATGPLIYASLAKRNNSGKQSVLGMTDITTSVHSPGGSEREGFVPDSLKPF